MKPYVTEEQLYFVFRADRFDRFVENKHHQTKNAVGVQDFFIGLPIYNTISNNCFNIVANGLAGLKPYATEGQQYFVFRADRFDRFIENKHHQTKNAVGVQDFFVCFDICNAISPP